MRGGARHVSATAGAIVVAVVAWGSRACLSGKAPAPPAPPHGIALTGYHGGPQRLGWNDAEPALTPDRVRALAPAWSSDALESAIVDGRTYAPHLYASPLYLDDVDVASPAFGALHTSVVVVATSNGDVYAVNAVAASQAPAGAILWRAHLGEPSQPARSSDGVPLGILSTPVVDLAASPPRVYATCADATAGWRAFALDLGSGAVLPGWPVVLAPAAIQAVDSNTSDGGAATFADFHVLSQRGALNLSPDGRHLYAGFGSYYDGAIGWMTAIDTGAARLEASFSGAASDVPPPNPPDPNADLASAGMWGAGGPAVAPDGRLFVTTGNSPDGSAGALGVWGNSLLRWSPPLRLDGTYSPWNYCLLDAGDTDLGGGSPIVFDLDPSKTSTPHLAAFGGKQGNLYLVDRDALTGALDRRPPCDPAHPPAPEADGSLVPPSAGPLNVFGPYSDGPMDNEVNNAKARTSPAFFRDAAGDAFLYATGSTRTAGDLGKLVPPSLVRVRVVTSPGGHAYLAVVASAPDVVFSNPGSPVVTSFRSGGAVVWVTDENGLRTDPLVPMGDKQPPLPVLYAFDAVSLELLFRAPLSAPGGKYNHPVIAHGVVYVGTDRLVAFAAP